MVDRPGLLFVSYYFPPTKSIACIRNYNICAEFLTKFHVHVFSTSNSKKFISDKYPPLPLSSKTLLKTLDPRSIISQKPVKSKIKKGNSISFLYRLLNSFPWNITFGIGGLIYVTHGVIAGLRLVKRENVEVLYSSYFPYSDHFICFLIKTLNPNIKWVADFRDLHYDGTKENIIHKKWQYWFNKRILRKANLVTTVSLGLQKQLIPFHKNSIVVRNAFGSLNSKILEKVKIIPKSHFSISYTGNLIPEKRNPTMLFKAILQLDQERLISSEKFKIVYAGNYKEQWTSLIIEENINRYAITNGLVSLENAYSLQKNSDVNLLLSSSDSNTSGVLTGKFYEYLAAEKPIILILTGDSKDSEFEHIFRRLSCGKIFYYHEPDCLDKLRDYIFTLYNQWEIAGHTSCQYNRIELKKFTTKSQVAKIFEHLEIE